MHIYMSSDYGCKSDTPNDLPTWVCQSGHPTWLIIITSSHASHCVFPTSLHIHACNLYHIWALHKQNLLYTLRYLQNLPSKHKCLFRNVCVTVWCLWVCVSGRIHNRTTYGDNVTSNLLTQTVYCTSTGSG